MMELQDHRFGMRRIVIGPGEHVATDRDVILCTVLGSCVAACFFDSVHGVAAMNHFMLPGSLSQHESLNGDPGRYGGAAMELALNAMYRLGAERQYIHVKLFGGGRMLDVDAGESSIGDTNSFFATDYVLAEGIPARAIDLGGTVGRKVLAFIKSGEVLVYKWPGLGRPRTLPESKRLRQMPSNPVFGEFTDFSEQSSDGEDL